MLLISTRVDGQFYRPFPEGEAVWTVVSEHIKYCPLDANAFTQYHSYIIQVGDTTINANTYHKIYREPFINPPNGLPYSFADTGYIGALRQNIALKQVYVFLKNDTTERLLYDFSLDSVNSQFPNTLQKQDNAAKLVLVDTFHLITPNGFTFRFVYYDTAKDICGNELAYTVVEGIGSIGGGLITKVGFFNAPGTSNYLIDEYITCFAENGILVEHSSFDTTLNSQDSLYCISTLTAGFTELPGAYHIKVYPNPVADQINISCNDLPSGHQYFYTVFDVLGNIIIHQQIQPAGTVIYSNSLSTGFYCWQVTNEQGIKLTDGKLIKQ